MSRLRVFTVRTAGSTCGLTLVLIAAATAFAASAAAGAPTAAHSPLPAPSLPTAAVPASPAAPSPASATAEGTPDAASAAALTRRYRTAAIATSKTSIYIGSVTLNVEPLVLSDGAYQSKYVATVFPYFFYNERGTLAIAMPAASLLRVSRSEPVEFTGRALSSDGEERRISGKATPSDATHGRIKVRIYVSKRIALIFNTTYEIRP